MWDDRSLSSNPLRPPASARILHLEPLRRAPRAIRRVLALRYDSFKPHLAGMSEDGRAVAFDVCSLNRMPGLARRPDPNSNARLWTSLFTGRPVGFLEF